MNSTTKNVIAYRKSLFLIALLLLLLAFIPVAFIISGIRNSRKAVINNFGLDKSEVWDQTTKAYNRFLFDSIPTLSYYRGILDSATFSPMAYKYLKVFPFLDSIQLYNLNVNSSLGLNGLSVKHLNFQVGSVYRFSNSLKDAKVKKGRQSIQFNSESPDFLADCTEPILNFSKLVLNFDSTQNINSNQIFQYFYRISDRKVTYLSIPGKQELSMFHEIMKGNKTKFGSKQNLVVFKLNPFNLSVNNIRPDLYQTILIRPLSFDSLLNNEEYFTTSITLPTAFSDFQLYFISSKEYLFKQALQKFVPPLFLFLGAYFLIALIGFLIYRNLFINDRLFKLQYDFINNFTHEFKTPVSVIKITGESLKNEVKPSARELGIYGRILEEEADKLNNLMNRLLSFTQLENKVIRVFNDNLNLEDFFLELKDEYQLKYPQFKIDFILEDLKVVKTDKVLLNSIFSNLVENAFKYSYPNKKVLKIIGSRIKRGILFRFIDQGVGIESSEIIHIFNKFYKIENEFNVHGSIGIGLAFCKEVIALMNGEITVESKIGIGTEFRVKVPDLS